MHEWHNDDCNLQRPRTAPDGVITYWCDTHGQWAYDHPTATHYSYNVEAAARFERLTGEKLNVT